MLKKHGTLFVISAPSGAGKTTLVTRLCQEIGEQCNLERVVTYTTKQPRLGEIPSVDYHFLSEQEFCEKIDSGFFVEWSTAYGNYYGSPAHIINNVKQGKSYIIIVDRSGAIALRRHYSQAILIWIAPPSIEILSSRLDSRGTESDQQKKDRLLLALQEIQQEHEGGLFNYCIINDNFEKALSELKSVVEKILK